MHPRGPMVYPLSPIVPQRSQAGPSADEVATSFVDLYYDAVDKARKEKLAKLFDADSMVVFHGNQPVIGAEQILSSLFAMRPVEHTVESVQVRASSGYEDPIKIYVTGRVQFGNSHALLFSQTFNIIVPVRPIGKVVKYRVRDSIFAFRH